MKNKKTIKFNLQNSFNNKKKNQWNIKNYRYNNLLERLKFNY